MAAGCFITMLVAPWLYGIQEAVHTLCQRSESAAAAASKLCKKHGIASRDSLRISAAGVTIDPHPPCTTPNHPRPHQSLRGDSLSQENGA